MKFNFASNKVVDSLDKVPKDFHGLYKQHEGKYVLDTEDARIGAAVIAVTKLNEALDGERAGHEATKKQVVDLDPLSEYGATPTAIADAFKTKLSTAGKGAGKEDIETHVRQAKEALAQAHAKEIEAHKKRGEALQQQLYRYLVTSEADAALVGAGTIDADLARPHLVNKVKVVEQDGEFLVQVVDDHGEVRYSGTTGKPMTIKERVAEMKGEEKYGPLFKSETPGGGGAPGTRRPAVTRTGAPTKELTATEKIKQGLDKKQFVRGTS